MSIGSAFINFLLMLLAICVLKSVWEAVKWMFEKWKRRDEEREEQNGHQRQQQRAEVVLDVEDFGDEATTIPSYLRRCDGKFPDLPEELWCEILDYVKDPQDIMSCLNTSPVWNRILDDQKTNVMLPSILPHLVGCLDVTSLLKCRLVSSHWKSVIDEFLENFQRNEYRPLYRITKMDMMIAKNDITEMAQIQNFITGMGLETPFNPFPSRSLQISVSPMDFTADVETILLYSTTTTELIMTFGHHLHRFHYTMKVFEHSHFFRRLLNFLPSLQHLELEIPFLCTENFANLFRIAFEEPLPTISSLKSLSVIPTSGRLAPIILNALLRDYGDQLEVLQCYGEAFAAITQQRRRNRARWLPNLCELSLDYVNENVIRILLTNSWNLEKLYLIFSRSRRVEGEKVKLESLLRLINTMAETLTLMHLCTDWTLDDNADLFLIERKDQSMNLLRSMNKFSKLKTLVISRDLMEVDIVHHLVKENFVDLERLSIDLGMFKCNEYSRGERMNDDSQNVLWKLSSTLKVIEREGRLLTWDSFENVTVVFSKLVKRKCFREIKFKSHKSRKRNGRRLSLRNVTRSAAHVVIRMF